MERHFFLYLTFLLHPLLLPPLFHSSYFFHKLKLTKAINFAQTDGSLVLDVSDLRTVRNNFLLFTVWEETWASHWCLHLSYTHYPLQAYHTQRSTSQTRTHMHSSHTYHMYSCVCMHIHIRTHTHSSLLLVYFLKKLKF